MNTAPVTLRAAAAIEAAEAPSADMGAPAYEYFSRLGFGRPYARTHYARL
jgi:hypothetical protein